jgi:hypothetical protein
VRWGWRESSPRRPSQNVTGPRFRLNHSAKRAVCMYAWLEYSHMQSHAACFYAFCMCMYLQKEYMSINIAHETYRQRTDVPVCLFYMSVFLDTT